MVYYNLRLVVKVDDQQYWKLENIADGEILPSVNESVTIFYDEGVYTIFGVISVNHYPYAKLLKPLVIAVAPIESIDKGIMLVHAINKQMKFGTTSVGIVRPNWYSIFRLVEKFNSNIPVVNAEIARSIMVFTNFDIASKNELFDIQISSLLNCLKSAESIIEAFSVWDKIVQLDDLQIADEVIQPMVINVERFLAKAGVDSSLWPIDCLQKIKS